MKEELISFETAKLAKEKGFLLHTIDTFYQYDGSISLCHYQSTRALEVQDKERVECYAPTQSLLQKWLREKHKIHIEPQYSWLLDDDKKIKGDVVWWYYIYSNYPHGGRRKTFSSEIGEPSTYEEALEEGLLEALKLIEIE